MSHTDEILDSLDINRLANQVGAPQSEVENAVRRALPALLMGLGANAQDTAGEASIISALDQHDPHLLDNQVDPATIDTRDGEKITHHIFGDNEEAVVDRLGGVAGGNDLVRKLLPILAPIVMAWLARKMGGQAQRESSAGGGVLGDILGQVLGRPTASQAPPQVHPDERPSLRADEPQQRTTEDSDGGILGDLLGGLLGRGRR